MSSIKALAISAGALALSLGIANLYADTTQLLDLYEVRFCPETANKIEKFGSEIYIKSQQRLDTEFCNKHFFILKDVWRTRKRNNYTIPDTVAIKLIPNTVGDDRHKLWLIPGLCLLGYSAYYAHTLNFEDAISKEIEKFKTQIKLESKPYRVSRQLSDIDEQLELQLKADGIEAVRYQERVKLGLMNPEADQRDQRMVTELQDTAHRYKLSQMEKTIAENFAAKREADNKGVKNEKSNNTSKSESKFDLGDDYKWINQILKQPFRILTGLAGSGKSTLERMMIRLLVEEGWHVVVVNPETNPNIWTGVEVKNKSTDINDFLSSVLIDLDAREAKCINLNMDEDDFLDYCSTQKGRDGRIAIFLMEANTFENKGVDPDIWAAFLRRSLTNVRKWGYAISLTSHGDNQTAISSKLKGFGDEIAEVPNVNCIHTENEKGEIISSGTAELKIKGRRDKNPVLVKLYNYPREKDFAKYKPK